MDWATLKSDIADYLVRGDLPSALIPANINRAMRKCERLHNWKHMQTITTGTLTTDNFSIPTRYKQVMSMFVTVNSRQRELRKEEYRSLIIRYPYGSNSPAAPEAFALLQGNSKFYVRPYPDENYNYELVTYNYSAELSDSNTTNWFMENAHELLLYGALILLEPYLKNTENMAVWEKLYAEILNEHAAVSISEDNAGSFQSCVASYDVV